MRPSILLLSEGCAMIFSNISTVHLYLVATFAASTEMAVISRMGAVPCTCARGPLPSSATLASASCARPCSLPSSDERPINQMEGPSFWLGSPGIRLLLSLRLP